MAQSREIKGYGTYTTELHNINGTKSATAKLTEQEITKCMTEEKIVSTDSMLKSSNKQKEADGLINKAFVEDDDLPKEDVLDQTASAKDKVHMTVEKTTNEMEPIVDVDRIWKALGVWKPYQIFQMIYIYICTIPVAYPILSWVFIGYTPPFRCKGLHQNLSDYNIEIDGNSSDFRIEYGKCELTIFSTNHTPYPYRRMKPKRYDCLNGYQYDYDEGETVTMEWSLICEKSGLGELSTTMVIIGICVGGAIFTGLADRFGRKTVAVYTHILLLVCNIALAFMPIFPVFAGVRLFIGSFQQGLGLSTAIILIEMFPVEWRGFLGLPGALNWTFCVCTLALFAYLMRNLSWRYLQIVLSLVSIHALFGHWILDESLRWLIANKRNTEAARNVRKAAKWNNKVPDKILPLLNTKNQEVRPLNESEEDKEANVQSDLKSNSKSNEILQTKEANQDSDSRYTMVDILKNRILLRNSIILWYAWLVNSGVYYGLFLTSGDLSVGNRYLNFFINGLVEIPAAFMYYAIINRIGRKYTSVVFHGIAGVSLILSVVFLTISTESGDTASIVSLIFSYAGKLGISASFNTVFIYTPELYPTNLRNLGIGLASTAGRLGGVMSPYASVLMRNVAWGPGVLFGSGCLLAMVLMFVLPETGNYVLPQTIEEMEAWVKEQSYFRPFQKAKSAIILQKEETGDNKDI